MLITVTKWDRFGKPRKSFPAPCQKCGKQIPKPAGSNSVHICNKCKAR